MGEKPDCGGAIVVADGDESVRTLIASLLERLCYETHEAETGYEVLAIASKQRPRLVLLDVELTGVTGYEVCRELRDRYGNALPLVFLSSTRVGPIDRIAGLLIGADDYVVKPFDSDELLARIRSLLRRAAEGEMENSPASVQSLDGLTRREREVLDLLAQGYSQTDIARELFITPKTVATHIQRVLSKLGVHSRAQAVALVLGGVESSEIRVPVAR